METRSAKRVSVNLKIASRIDNQGDQKFSISQGDIFEVEVVDISVSGIGVFSKYFLPKGLIIDIDIDGKVFGSDKVMKMKGELRYCRSVKISRYRCGIRFVDPPAEYIKIIAEFISKNERRQDPRVKLAD